MKAVEIQIDSNSLTEAFLAWLQEDGFEQFEDWVLNFCDGIDGVTVDFDLVDEKIVVIEEE